MAILIISPVANLLGQTLGSPYLFTEALMLVPIDFLSCKGFIEKLAEGQFFIGAWAAEKINRNSTWFQNSASV